MPAELSPGEMRRLTGHTDSVRVTGHELAERFDRVSRNPAKRLTTFISPPAPGEHIETAITVSDKETSMYRSPDGNIHVARWRDGKARGVLEFNPLHLAPRTQSQ